MERIEAGQPFGVIVDYAHSPASLQGVLDLLAPDRRGTRRRADRGVRVGRGAGHRQAGRRWAGSRVSAAGSSSPTDEDPRGEDRDAIIDEIVRGAEAAGRRRGVDVLAIADRREAIGAAFERARPGDLVLLAGKGHEPSILYADGPVPWDEAGVARQLLAAMRLIRADPMRGCLFIVALAIVAIVLVIVVGLPAFAAGMLTAGVSAAGLQAADTTVTVSSDPPTDLVGLHADRVRVRATDATFRGLRIGALDVTLGDVALVERTAARVDGRLQDVVAPNVGGRPLSVASIVLSGGGQAVHAATTIPSAEAESLIADGIESALGAHPDDVTLSAPDRVTVTLGPATVHGRLVVSGGNLVAHVLDGPAAGQDVVLLRGGEDLPIRLTSVTVTAAGDLRLVGDLAVGILG